MGSNWTETLRRRNAGEAPGFVVPRNLDKLERSDLDDEAEVRGIDTAELKTKGDVAAAIQGR